MRELQDIDPQRLPDALLTAADPILVRGLAAHWKMVQADAIPYLRRFGADSQVGVWRGAPGCDGRFFYDEAFRGFNFEREIKPLGAVLDELSKPGADVLYVGSTTIDTVLPGFRTENDLGFGAREPLASIWLGNRTCVAAHFDVPDNLACVVAGRRRFTLLPPDEVENLYVGPFEMTPAGQAISLADLRKPDFERFPRLRQALERAQVVDLEPGDALFIPSMWWHQVEGLDDFNVLVNYWWRTSPEHIDTPHSALMLAMMTIRELPPSQCAAWRAMFEHYVFDAAPAEHIPEHARGLQGAVDERLARMLRAQLIRRLNR